MAMETGSHAFSSKICFDFTNVLVIMLLNLVERLLRRLTAVKAAKGGLTPNPID